MKTDELVILGGGIAGISACYHAHEKKIDATCYEANEKPGGLVANFTIQGFRFDNAVHLSFTKNEYVRSIFDKVDYITHKPDAYCLDRGLWLKHPIQNNLFPLPIAEKVSHIKSFIERPCTNPENYSEWLEHQYGYSIANKYPKSYTKKYWGLDATKLSTTWIGNRMRRAEIDEILLGALEERDDNHYYANEMRYPKNGGYFEFIKDIAINIKLNKQAVKIDVIGKEVAFSDGSKVLYSELISTLPLPTLCSIIKNCPAEVMDAANSLLWTTVDLISIGFDKSDIPPYLWFYIYDEANVAARAYSPSWKAKSNAPEGKSSLQFEIYNLSTEQRQEPENLIANIKEKLLEMQVCSESDILFMHHKHLPFGNVVFDHGMEYRRKIVLDYLDSVNIHTCGRFGEWDYLWSDQSFLSGQNSVSKISV
ncbi:protoporphyrinogen/coproporphyrinogen oxidase [Shewanella oncorhynchi]|uniref:protoporphyrinogen/coproporphyrinogen oxidase n=1 Tax=Shewanella oncorhynchi TaxID=2726434 RepID=UPI003D7A33D0